jgi:hypothetical protein
VGDRPGWHGRPRGGRTSEDSRTHEQIHSDTTLDVRVEPLDLELESGSVSSFVT